MEGVTRLGRASKSDTKAGYSSQVRIGRVSRGRKPDGLGALGRDKTREGWEFEKSRRGQTPSPPESFSSWRTGSVSCLVLNAKIAQDTESSNSHQALTPPSSYPESHFRIWKVNSLRSRVRILVLKTGAALGCSTRIERVGKGAIRVSV